MKRPVYEITVAGLPPVRRYAWNSALRAMETEIRSLMTPGQVATKETLSIVKLDKWTTGSGTFIWTVSDGRTIVSRGVRVDRDVNGALGIFLKALLDRPVACYRNC